MKTSALSVFSKINSNVLQNSRRLFSFNFEMTPASRQPEAKEETKPEEQPKNFRYNVCQPRTSPVERPNSAGDVMALQKQNVKAAIEEQQLQPSMLPEYYQKTMEKSVLTNPDPEHTEEGRINKGLNPKNPRRFQVSKTYANAILPLKSVKLANPFPEPVKMMMSRTVSDDEKAEQMLAEARSQKQHNEQMANKSSTFRSFSTEVRRWYSKTVGTDPEKCKKMGKGKKGCPKMKLNNCPAPARTRCDRFAKHIDCKKQEAPYPAYSEFCHEEIDEKPSSCKMCPWKPEENPNFKPSKKKFHTSSLVMVRRSGLEMDLPLNEDPLVETNDEMLCDLRKPPCERPKNRRCPEPKNKKKEQKKKKPKPKQECAILDNNILDGAVFEPVDVPQISLKTNKPKDPGQGPCKIPKFKFPCCNQKISRTDQDGRCPTKRRKPKVRDCPPSDKACDTIEVVEEYNLSGGGKKDKTKCPQIDMTTLREEVDDDPCKLKRKGTTKICPGDLLKKKRRKPKKKTSGVIAPLEKIEPPQPTKTV
ncbi:uncharacterized protein LOC123009233 [Tribolium madens]|uniref:uncharacterized protein LOC123009233 n=1 Tax=Tribolium madens TaxID=41895 RepID=UPI001CF763ED|nr:uncharacterized protein LOC123009233 [Tribolium madens]